ncbi:MAG: hypothetical protein E7C95_00630 [Anaerococcus prevotii]|uniref:hypothetical protein n=1 Tax=Anaerococcus prevotii TaxID=33034 RepID=UPI0028FE0FE1|nr:hypothetical protein [Anaerococcus prevotii]MDU2557458.1 hypothetical protein [Anaerococcus prevotii]
MIDIDKELEEFHKENRLIKEELSTKENLLSVFSKLDETNQEKLLSYAADLYYSHKYQTEIRKVPLLDLKLKD